MTSRECGFSGLGWGFVSRGAVVAALFLALGFTAGAASGSDNAAFVSYTGVPTSMKPNEEKTVTVKMRNTGTTSWKTTINSEYSDGVLTTTRTSYHLDPVGHGWGVSGVTATGNVAPNAIGTFTFKITAPSAQNTYPFQWRMVRLRVITNRPIVPARADEGFGAATPKRTIRVANTPPPPPDTAPSFGTSQGESRDWLVGHVADPITLPEATGGNGTLNYSFFGCRLPEGTRRKGRWVGGTPTMVKSVICTWKVTDTDSNWAESDSAKLTYRITARQPVLVPSVAKLTVAEKGTGSFTVKLGVQPKDTVTVTPEVAAGDASEVRVTSRPLSFTTTRWAKPQTVTVEGLDDEDAENETATVNLNGSGGGYSGVSAAVTVIVTDPDTYGPPIVDPTSLTVKEGASKALKVKLPTQPTGNVTVTLAMTKGKTGAVTMTPASLTFKTTNYADWQTVQVTGGHDADAADEGAEVTVAARGGGYSGESTKVPVAVDDDDVRKVAVSVSSSRALAVDENGSNTFTVWLATQPTDDVTVSVSSDDPGAATASPSSLTFSPTNYGRGRTVTVSGRDDPDATDEKTTVRLTASGADYGGLSASVNVAVDDDDTRAVVVSPAPPAILKLAEGGSKPFSVQLATQPTGPVTVTVSVPPHAVGEVTVSPTRLTFSTGNYSAWQTVWVTGEEDEDAADEEGSVLLGASGADYGGQSASVWFNVDDDEEPALLVSRANLSVDEGDSDTFTVKLATEPTATVTVSVTSEDPGPATVSPASLTFTTSNYGVTQTVTVTAKQDDDAEDETTKINLAASGGDYGDESATVAVEVKDDDTSGLVVAPSSLDLIEGAAGKTFTVKLATEPTASVTVSLTREDSGAASVSPSSLTFTKSNYGVTQTVTVTAKQDDDAEDESTNVNLAASGGDYGAESATVAVKVEDDDTSGLVVAPSSLDLIEGAAGKTFTVKLATEPTASVTVSVTSKDSGAASASPSSLTFTTSNYGVTQTVTVTGKQDDDAKDETTKINLAASGGDYGDESATVAVKVSEDDTSGLVVAPSSLDLVEGAAGKTFTVKLTAEPSATVTVGVESRGADTATVSPASLTFGAGNYGVTQTVTVTGEKAGATTVDLSASGGGYGGVSAGVAVTVRAPDTSPAFGKAGNETFVQGEPVAVDLQVTGGNAPVECSVSPTLPVGVKLDAAACVLSGTPTEAQEAVEYTFTATDADDDRTTLSFTIAVTAPTSDDASFVRFVGVPATMTAGSSATVTVRMRNTGTTTWSASGGYQLGSQRPDDNETWGLSRVALPSDVAPGGTVDFVFAITAPETAGRYSFRWKMIRGAEWFGRKTGLQQIEVSGEAADDAWFVEYRSVPSRMAAGSSATVTVRMRNAGTTTWTSSAGYELGSQRPDDNVRWGLSRVALPSEVPPNGEVDFTFEVVAPETVKGHKFRWRMVRGTDGWFGGRTELHEITVEDPSFGDASVPAQTWAKNVPIESFALPGAVGGDGALTYSLTPSLPEGVTFTAATRALSGTPTKLQEATEYTLTATDTSGAAAALVFSIRVEEASVDDASFVSVSGVPSKIAAGHAATVTVTMENTGTTTWTSLGGYGLAFRSPQSKDTWGLRRAPLPGSVSPGETVDFEFPITAPETTGSYTFSWQMVRDPGMRFGSDTGLLTIQVEDPSFGDQTVADQTWLEDEPLEAIVFPAASGGEGRLGYGVSPELPAGVRFDPETRVLSGTPTTPQAAVEYTYTVRDLEGSAAELVFSITVEQVLRDEAFFVSISGVPTKIAAGHSATVTVTMKNTGTTTWTPFGGYGLGAWGSQSKDTWGVRRAPLSGSVAPNETAEFTFEATAPETTGSYKFVWRMVRDPGMWFGPDTGEVRITVEDPSFGDGNVPDQTWVLGEKATVTLPAASGGAGPLTYALTPAPPDGVAFSPSTRVLSGTPTALQAATAYIYTATDKEGNAATLAFTITVSQSLNVAQESNAPVPGAGGGGERGSPPPSGVFDMFEYWLLPHGRALPVEAGGGQAVRSFWRGELWGRTVALAGDPEGRRYDIFEEVGDGLDYGGTFEGASAVGEGRLSWSLDRPFRWMNRFMAVGDVLEAPVTGRLLSERRRNQEGVVKTTVRLEILGHRASFDVPAVPGLTFEDVLVVRFWPDASRPEAHDTFVLARGLGAVHWRRSGVGAPGEVALWWAVGKELTPVALSAPFVPWFDPFSPGWPKTAVVNGNLEDAASGWMATSGDVVLGPTPSGLTGGDWSLLLPGGADRADADADGDVGAPSSGADGADGADVAITEDWIPVAGGTYELSACMLRENAADNVFVDLADGKGRDADFADAHLVAGSTGTWECRAVAMCIPGSVGAVRVRAVRRGADPGDAWFDRIELKRIAACAERPAEVAP